MLIVVFLAIASGVTRLYSGRWDDVDGMRDCHDRVGNACGWSGGPPDSRPGGISYFQNRSRPAIESYEALRTFISPGF